MAGIINAHSNHSYLIRVGPDCRAYGDPWTWCVNVEDEGEGCCHLYGVERMPTPDEQAWCREVLAGYGFSQMRWTRIRNGKERTTRYFSVCS